MKEALVEKDAVPPALREMLDHESALYKKAPKEWLERYKRLYLYLRQKMAKGELPTHPNYLGGNELAESIYRRKYYLKDLSENPIEQRPEDVFVRVAAFIAAVEDDGKAEEWAEIFYKDLFDGLWIPGGRILAGAGDFYRSKTLANCFVAMIKDDSIESIYNAAYEAARTYSYGGGIGIDLAVLRPAGAVVHNAADESTGAVSFMELYSTTTGLIGQSGRRGALMLTLDAKHPDIESFIKVKQVPNWTTEQIRDQLKWSSKFTEEQLALIEKTVMENTQVRFANISIKASDEFMHAVVERNRYGRKYLIYKKLIKGTRTDVLQDYTNVHYSIEMPSRDIKQYEFLAAFNTFEEMAAYIAENYGFSLNKEDFKAANKRDVYGDYHVALANYNYDLALRQGGDYLLYFASGEVGSIKVLVDARKIWNMFVESNYKTAEPGIMFWTRVTRYSPSNYVGKPIVTTNPCGEVPLEDGGSCNLSSINLARMVDHPFTSKAKIKWRLLERAVEHLHRFLDNIISWNIYLNPLEKQRVEGAKATRRIGMGVVAIADMLMELGYAYDSEDGIKVIGEVMKRIANKAYESSAKVAKEKGTAPTYDWDKYKKNPFFNESIEPSVRKLVEKYGMRNIAVLSIAPTGSISNIVKSLEVNGKNYIGVSSGIEPVFAIYYNRRSESFGNKIFRVFHSTIEAYLDMKSLSDKAATASQEELKNLLPTYFFRTAHVIDPMKRVEIQAVVQKYIDHSISSTVNLPEDIHPEVISEIYLYAWQKGLKGITVYRDGSRYPILSVEGEKTEFQKFKDKKFKITVNGKELVVKGDEIIVLPDGTLTTVYHGIKDGIFKGVEL